MVAQMSQMLQSPSTLRPGPLARSVTRPAVAGREESWIRETLLANTFFIPVWVSAIQKVFFICSYQHASQDQGKDKEIPLSLTFRTQRFRKIGKFARVFSSYASAGLVLGLGLSHMHIVN